MVNFLEFAGGHQEDLLNHSLVNCYLPKGDYELMRSAKRGDRYCLEELEAQEMLLALSELSACDHPLPPSEIIEWLAGYLNQTSAVDGDAHFGRLLPHLKRARYKNHLQVVN